MTGFASSPGLLELQAESGRAYPWSVRVHTGVVHECAALPAHPEQRMVCEWAKRTFITDYMYVEGRLSSPSARQRKKMAPGVMLNTQECVSRFRAAGRSRCGALRRQGTKAHGPAQGSTHCTFLPRDSAGR